MVDGLVKSDGDDVLATQSASSSAAVENQPGEAVVASPPRLVGTHVSHHVDARERYQIVGEHGRGGLGRVFRARDLHLGRDVAIKELLLRGNTSETRFLREAMITARLEHPGIVPVHEAGTWSDGTPFYCMKLVAGRSLRELLAERKTVAEKLGLLHHVIAVADAIAYAHGKNIIHRDLKPANVIVGEFGETIVIDWGIAKDLSATEDATIEGGPFRKDGGHDLTSAGSVLGTPAYMAPEQERGEQVDQRADVFAIGAMLWELCARSRVPPDDRRQRHRMLRSARIDEDLITIIEKALADDRRDRYPDAGALAADLKAFKSGLRISARDYSLFEMVAHWLHRHRALGISLAAAVCLTITAAVFYVRNIAAERDRADAALVRAEAANRAAVHANRVTNATLADEILKHAELLLATDPSAALDELGTYRGDDQFQSSLLRAAAEGRGVARTRATPHLGAILWAHGLRDQSVATLGIDGTVAVTTAGGTPRVVAQGGAGRGVRAYGHKRQILAYVCTGPKICLVDFSGPVPAVMPALGQLDPAGLAFSAEADRLAAVTRDNIVVMWDISNLQTPVELYRGSAAGRDLFFVDNEILAVVDSDEIVTLSRLRSPARLPLRGVNAVDVAFQRNILAAGTVTGNATLIDATSRQIGNSAKLCVGPVNVLRFMPGDDKVAYACKNGNVGMWDTRSSAVVPLMSLPGTIDYLTPSWDGRELALAGSANVMSVLDISAGLVTSYLGHGSRINAVAAPDASYPYFVSADAGGQLRVWSRSRPLARVAYAAPSRLIDTLMLGDSVTSVTSSGSSSLHVSSPSGETDVGPHELLHPLLEPSPDKTLFAAFGWDGKIELWTGREPRLLRTIQSSQASVSQLKFISNDEIVWAGPDGHICRWSSAGGIVVVASFPQAVATFDVLRAHQSLVVELANGELWFVMLENGQTSRLASQTSPAKALRLSSDGRWLATGSTDGVVAVYDTTTWKAAVVFRAAAAIHHIVFSPDSSLLAVATIPGMVHLARAPLAADKQPAWLLNQTDWKSFSANPRYLAFSPDGDLLMIACVDGVIWFYSVVSNAWLHYSTGLASISVVRPSLDGHRAATVDSIGRLLMVDLDSVRAVLH